MDIYSIKKTGSITSDISAIGFYYNDSQIFHLGLLFIETPGEDAKFLHLARHHSLRTENIGDSRFWIRLGLTDRQIRQLAGMCAMISEHNSASAVPFSIFYDNNRQYFDEKGNYSPSGLGDGLTCATFVMAIFETLGIPLLQTDDWATEIEDQLWHSKIIQDMRAGAPDQAHFDAMSENIGCARYRPADIIIASSKKNGRPLRQATVRKAYGALYKKVTMLSA